MTEAPSMIRFEPLDHGEAVFWDNGRITRHMGGSPSPDDPPIMQHERNYLIAQASGSVRPTKERRHARR